MTTRRLLAEAFALILVVALAAPLARAQDAPASDPVQPEEPRRIDLRQAPPGFRLGMRVLTHRHVRQASPVLVIADTPDDYVRAIALWTDRVIFPVLIDDGSVRAAEDIARFVRAFQPEKVLRLTGAGALPEDGAARREALERTLAGIWGLGKPETPADEVMTQLVSHLQFAVHLPPGVVVADEDDPAWTAALALAAGHAQPMVWYDRAGITADVNLALDHAQTQELIASIETSLEELGMPWEGLGDMIDGVTLCLNIPAKCQLSFGENASERFALTDAVGMHRALDSARGARLQRWAWAGQVFGDESRSAYRAMCSLFLQPRRAWIFDGYPTSEPWNAYDGGLTRDNLAKANLPATLIDAPRIGLESWHASTTKALDADVVFVNTKGLAEYFDLEPGRAYANDVPLLDHPAAVSLVHSWSATTPGNPWSIAGAWLESGAFMYVGSVHEPFLQAFIPTPIFAIRLMGGLPWGVACRPDGLTPVWKIAVLGDPLLAIGAERPRSGVIEIEDAEELASEIPGAAKAEDFARLIRLQTMLGHDAEAVRLAGALLRDREEAFSAEVAELSALPAFRAGDKALLAQCVLRLPKEQLAGSRIASAIWHAAESDLRTGTDNALASALERSLGGAWLVRDAARLASAVELTHGVNVRNVLLDRIADSQPDANIAKEIRKAKR